MNGFSWFGYGLTACASDYVTTTSGQIIVAKGKLELDKATGMARYVDQDGNEYEIHPEQISEMLEK
ncbi:YgdI/YgdR family lipoprotein [Pragia fontium]|uniref:YgdI/YgdR family lipoprotein n=1 Tax=Pragia fontium TaxID=82985 RepID=UPI000E0E6FED